MHDNKELNVFCGKGTPAVQDRGNQRNEKFKHSLAPLYKLPSKQKFKGLVKKQYEDTKTKTISDLLTVKYVSLTSDLWTDTINNQSYIDVTVHFLKKNNHESITLGVMAVHESHSSANISNWLLEILSSWEIRVDQVFSIVTDNAKNISLAAVSIFGNSRHMGCFAHKLNLVMVSTLKHTPLANDIIKKIF